MRRERSLSSDPDVTVALITAPAQRIPGEMREVRHLLVRAGRKTHIPSVGGEKCRSFLMRYLPVNINLGAGLIDRRVHVSILMPQFRDLKMLLVRPRLETGKQFKSGLAVLRIDFIFGASSKYKKWLSFSLKALLDLNL